MSLAPGTELGPYRIVGVLGRGGMAAVYRAHDPALERDVALKVLPPEFLHEPGFAERFQKEARVTARLEHPHLVPVHGFGTEGGRPWMAMRLMSGGSLADRLRLGPIAPLEVAATLSDVASALDYAHARGIVHRDVKPANVLLDEARRAYLADFGIARMLEGTSAALTSELRGTPNYMAPEQAMGVKPGPPADVYALAVMAFECLTGRLPFTGSGPVEILLKHVSQPVPEIAADEVPPVLAAVLRRGLAKAPAERWPSAGAFAEAFEQAARSLTGTAARALELPTLEIEGDRGVATRVATRVATPVATGGAHTRGNGSRSASVAAWVWAGAGVAGALLVVLAVQFFRAPPLPSPAARPAVSASPAGTPAPAPTHAPAPTPEVKAVPSPVRVPASRSSAPAAASPRPTASLPTPQPVTPSLGDHPRLYLEARLEPVFFKKSSEKDVVDSLKDLKGALEKDGQFELMTSRARADAVVQVLERGREPAVIGMRKVRVRVLAGSESAELVGQDSMKGFNTWSGAAGGVVRQLRAWFAARGASPRR